MTNEEMADVKNRVFIPVIRPSTFKRFYDFRRSHQKKGGFMPTRNTTVLESIIKALGDTAPQEALPRLEKEFESSLLVVAGDVKTVAQNAEHLRLAITAEEMQRRPGSSLGSNHRRSG
jgi:hypothetical protein